jgi:hypothetical protein
VKPLSRLPVKARARRLCCIINSRGGGKYFEETKIFISFATFSDCCFVEFVLHFSQKNSVSYFFGTIFGIV